MISARSRLNSHNKFLRPQLNPSVRPKAHLVAEYIKKGQIQGQNKNGRDKKNRKNKWWNLRSSNALTKLLKGSSQVVQSKISYRLNKKVPIFNFFSSSCVEWPFVGQTLVSTFYDQKCLIFLYKGTGRHETSNDFIFSFACTIYHYFLPEDRLW